LHVPLCKTVTIIAVQTARDQQSKFAGTIRDGVLRRRVPQANRRGGHRPVHHETTWQGGPVALGCHATAV
jgi:hypothetical protein